MKKFGQALSINRPHLVENGFLTPLIKASEYQSRRQRVSEKMKPNSLLISPSNRIQFASPSVFYKFRQDPNFQYLTGFLEPDSCLLIYKDAQSKVQELLFVNEKDEFAEKWEGDRTGTLEARNQFQIDSMPNTHIRETVKSLVGASDVVYCNLDPKTTVRQGSFFNHELNAIVAQKASGQPTASDLIQELREIKSESEIDCLRVAGEISSIAYNSAYKRRFQSEKQLHGFLSFSFQQNGCEDDAYLAVVAGGKHALTIHYVQNDDLLVDGDLVLVDAAGRFGGYCADISRTWPVNGSFTAPQRDLYSAVLATEKSCIDLCTPASHMSLNEIHMKSEQFLQENLRNVGLDLNRAQLNKVYPHMIGHQLGLDVHDIGLKNSNQTELRSNQVVTIEPGVYVPDDLEFPSHFRGIGIRIEDNVVVGTVPENLTVDCLKEVEELER